MAKSEHIHTFIVVKRPKENRKPPREKLFICTKSDCGALVKGWQLEGKVGKCNACGNSMEYTYEAMKRAKPICKACIQRVNQKMVTEDTEFRRKVSLVEKLFGTTVVTTGNEHLESIPDLEELPVLEEIE